MIRSATVGDAASLAEFWRTAGLRFRPELVASELASVLRILAEAGISCNVIAASAHDHLFVEWDQGARALALLREV